MLVTHKLGHGLIHLLDGQWRGMRRFEQPTDAPRVGLDMARGDRVVGLDLEVEDRSGFQAQTVTNFLVQGELSLAGQRGEDEGVPSRSR